MYIRLFIPLYTIIYGTFKYKWALPIRLKVFFFLYFFISFFFLCSTLCKSFVNFISMLIYSTLWLYMSCWWLQFQKFWCSIGPGVNECAAGENVTVFFSLRSLRCCLAYNVCIFVCLPCNFSFFRFIFFLSFQSRSLFLHQHIPQLMAIHLNQCVT